MKVSVVGAGRIGSTVGLRLSQAGHDVLVSGSRDPRRLDDLAAQVRGRAGSLADATSHGEAFVVAVPWGAVDEVADALGDLGGRVLVDACNPYGPDGLVPLPGTATQVQAERYRGARLGRAFNTLTAAFQASVVERPLVERPAMFFVAEDAAAEVTETFVGDVGLVPVRLGGLADSALLEAPRRPGAVYGEEYAPDDARRVAAAVRAGDTRRAEGLARELAGPG